MTAAPKSARSDELDSRPRAVRSRALEKSWQQLLDTHSLVQNKREIQKIVISEQGDGAFAVVDIDTLWGGLRRRKESLEGKDMQGLHKARLRVETDHTYGRSGLREYGKYRMKVA